MKFLRLVSIVLLFVFFGSLLVHGLNSINQDIGRHIKSGQIIWETKQVYKTNLFSFTEPNKPFVNHHWLSEVAFYGLNNVIGLKGLILFKAGIILAALVLIFIAVYTQTGFWPLALSSLAGFMVFVERTDVRPEIFSYLFLSYFLFVIFRAKYNDVEHRYIQRRSTSLLYTLPLIQIFWTNMHIYFAVGPMLLLFFLIDRFFIKREEFKKAGYVFLATTAVTLINPNFITGALVPFNILRHYGYGIVENQNIFFLRDYGISLTAINLFEMSIFLLILSFIIAFKNGRRKSVFEILTSVFLIIMAGKMIRNFGLYGLTFIPIVALNLSTLSPLTMSNIVSPQVINTLSKRHRMSLISYAVLSAILIFLTLSVVNNSFYEWASSAKTFGLTIPAGAEKGVKFVKENGIKGPVFNNFDVGSFLIWKLYPEQKVFVDGRPEAYTVDFFEKIYKPMQEDPKAWNFYSQKYGINYIFFAHTDITPWARKFLSDISQNQEWPTVYVDDSTIIFLKRNSQNKNLIDKFKIR